MVAQVILVVEDSETEQYVLRQLLKRFDYDTQVVSSGEEAITAVKATIFAAILMDLTLPGIDGCECAKRIRLSEQETGRRTPIIAITARVNDSVRDDCMTAGMDDYMGKPFKADELRRMLLRHAYSPNQPNLKTLKPLSDENLDIIKSREKRQEEVSE